jgi:hypothetical protein
MSTVPVGKTIDRSTGLLGNTLQGFESFVGLVESLYGVSLPCPQFENLAELGEFCNGLINKGSKHAWRAACSRLSARARFGVAHSLFLFRKRIPKEKPLVSKYVAQLSQPCDRVDDDFLEFARKAVRKVFPFGWDGKYQDFCLTSSLPLTSCSESGRKWGGCRGLEEQGRWERSDFCQYVLSAVVPRQRGVSKVQAIETGGKWRVISIPPRIDNGLRPLHKAMYSHLSRFPWLLRGDAKPSRFKDLSPVEGVFFVICD